MLFEGPWYFARTGMEGCPHFKMIGLAEIAALMMEHSHIMEKKSASKNYEANSSARVFDVRRKEEVEDE